MKFEPTDYEDLKVIKACALSTDMKISDVTGERLQETLDRIIEEASKAAPLSEGWYLSRSSVSSVAQQVVYVKNGQVCRWSDGSGRIGSVAELRDQLTLLHRRDQLTPFPSSGISAYSIDQVAERLWAEINRRSRGEIVLWENISEGQKGKDYYRRLARAALGVGD